jgi:Cys-rich repeat protein
MLINLTSLSQVTATPQEITTLAQVLEGIRQTIDRLPFVKLSREGFCEKATDFAILSGLIDNILNIQVPGTDEKKETIATAVFGLPRGATTLDLIRSFAAGVVRPEAVTPASVIQAANVLCGRAAPPPGFIETKCTKDADCPAGQKCVNGQCVPVAPAGPQCTKDADCPAGQKCVNGQCVPVAPTPAIPVGLIIGGAAAVIGLGALIFALLKRK